MDIGTIQVEVLTFLGVAALLAKMALNDIMSKLQK